LIFRAAVTRVKLQVSVPISARSRRSPKVAEGMLPSSLPHSSVSSTGVAPVFSTCFGPRTAEAGLAGTIWATRSQSNSILTAARCCLSNGAEASFCSRSI
jgi:hypothetical protein